MVRVHTEQDKRRAVVAYFATGSSVKAAALTGVSERTIRRWRQTGEWWEGALEQVKRENQDELDAQYSAIITQAQEEVMDRLKNGDVVLVKTKDGYGEKRKLVSGKDAAVIGAVTFDKRQILRTAPVLAGTNKALEEITRQLEEIGRAERARIIEGQKGSKM